MKPAEPATASGLPAILFEPQVRLVGEVTERFVRSFLEQLDAVPEKAPESPSS